MRSVWDEDERDDCEEWLLECATRTLRAYMRELDVGHMRDFMRFVAEYEAAAAAEAVRLAAELPEREAETRYGDWPAGRPDGTPSPAEPSVGEV